MFSVNARHQVTTVQNETIWIHSDIPDTEKYILDEEANKDKLYCKTKTGAEGKVTQTDWYNLCTGEFVKSEKADKCTEEFRYPEYECEFAKGSNADKLYCRMIKDGEGTVVETRWFNYCSSELIKTEEVNTCTSELKSPVYKCYKYEAEEAVEETPKEEAVEETPKEVEKPVETPPLEQPEQPVAPVKKDLFSKIISFFSSLFR
ncbi:MAG: hypothetical protein Q8N77_01655 [Nanoarchaeota archaeon]|nr:hypothetical protein [Nanoarchaeota archaeon]